MTSLCFGVVAVLIVAYVGLIAIVMSYAALTVEFSQSVRNNETTIAALERQYLASMAHITRIDYVAAGYTIPSVKMFVPARSVTAVR